MVDVFMLKFLVFGRERDLGGYSPYVCTSFRCSAADGTACLGGVGVLFGEWLEYYRAYVG
jgi:hypothetical protein